MNRNRILGLGLLLLPVTAHAQTSSVRGPEQQVDRPMAESFLAGMASDLRNMVTAQEAYFSDHNSYGRVLSTSDTRAVLVRPSQGVTITLTYVTASGWTARATHDWVGGLSCVVWVGKVPPSRRIATRLAGQYSKEDGVPLCDAVPQ